MTREEAARLLRRIKPNDNNACSIMLNEALDMAIEALQEQKTGHWIEDENEMIVLCSECGEENNECSKHCPNCGAKMFEPQESEDKE